MSDGNNGGTGLTPMRALIEDLMKSTSCQTCQRALNMIHILIDSRDCETARSKAVIAASEEAIAEIAAKDALIREMAGVLEACAGYIDETCERFPFGLAQSVKVRLASALTHAKEAGYE